MGNHSSDPYPFFINTNLRALQRITEEEKQTEEHESYCKDKGNSRRTKKVSGTPKEHIHQSGN